MKSDTESEMDDSKNNIRNRQSQCSAKLDEVDSVLKKANNQRADDLRAIPLREEEMRDKLQQLV